MSTTPKKYQAISGMHDLYAPEILQWQSVEDGARQIFHAYGYSEIRMPLLEETDLFVRGIGQDTGVVCKEMYTFEDKGGVSMTLRPEGTASVVRAIVEHSLFQAAPLLKLYYMGPMFRHERPQKGRYRQFHQIGCELLGTSSPEADVEVVALADHMVRKLGVTNFELQINSLGNQDDRANYINKLKTYLSRYAADFGAEDRERIEKNPLRVLDSKNPGIQKILLAAPSMLDHLGCEARAHWEAVLAGLGHLNIPYTINTRIVRGLDYYGFTAFELISSELGAQNAFAGGGRYNGLVTDLGGPDLPGIGFAIGVERLILCLGDKNQPTQKKIIYIAFMGEIAFAEARKTAYALRKAGLSVDMDYEAKSLKSQLRHAGKLQAAHTIIFGEEEIKKGTAMVKDMKTNEQKEIPIDQLVHHFANQ